MKSTYRLLSSGSAALLFLLLLVWLPAIRADQAIHPFAANYRAYYFGMEVNAIRELKKRDDNTMMLRFQMQSFFADIDESSTFIWPPKTPPLLTPLAYHYHRTGLGKDRRTQLTFDWPMRQVINSLTNPQIPIPADTPVFDPLSYQLQLQYDLISGLTEFDYQVVDSEQLKHYRFHVIGEEVLTTELGKLVTTKVERVRDNSKRSTYIWFAKNWNYLMVQLQQREKNGSEYRIQLIDATVNGVDVHGE